MADNKKREIHRVLPVNPGRAPIRRLRPIVYMLLDERASIAELANRIGMDRSSVSRWLKADDARLSDIEDIGKALGYHLEWKFVKDKER